MFTSSKKVGRKEGRKGGRKEGRKDGRRDGRVESCKEGREGRKGKRKSQRNERMMVGKNGNVMDGIFLKKASKTAYSSVPPCLPDLWHYLVVYYRIH